MADEETIAAEDVATIPADDAAKSYPEGALVFRTTPHGGAWTSSEDERYVDETVIESPSETLIRDAAHAHAAGVIEIIQGVDTANLGAHGVQSQEEGEAAYEAAVASGDWQIGQDIQAAHEAELRETGEYGLTVEINEEGEQR